MATISSGVGYSILAIACFGLILFGIAVTIVLALIPIYLPSKYAAPGPLNAFQQELLYSIAVFPNQTLGPLNSRQMARVEAILQLSYTDVTRLSSAFTVKQATIVNGNPSTGGRKRRQGEHKRCDMLILFIGRTLEAIKTLEQRLTRFILEEVIEIDIAIEDRRRERTSTTSTTFSTLPTNIFSSTPGTPAPDDDERRRRRREDKKSSASRSLVLYSD